MAHRGEKENGGHYSGFKKLTAKLSGRLKPGKAKTASKKSSAKEY